MTKAPGVIMIDIHIIMEYMMILILITKRDRLVEVDMVEKKFAPKSDNTFSASLFLDCAVSVG